MALPMPAAAAAYMGDKENALNNTIASPQFIYPFAGEGICITIVATQQRAANTAVIIKVFNFSLFIVVLLEIFIISYYNQS